VYKIPPFYDKSFKKRTNRYYNKLSKDAFDKINNNTTVNSFKQISETGNREVSSSDILQINTNQEYMEDCKWMSTSATSWLIVTR